MIDIGLVVAPPWIDKILRGEKVWEIRSKPNSRTGRVALCRKGGGIEGTCLIGASIALSRKEFAQHFVKHRVTSRQLAKFYAGKRVYAWPLSDVRAFALPIAYQHPGGGSWVKLTPRNVADWPDLRSAA